MLLLIIRIHVSGCSTAKTENSDEDPAPSLYSGKIIECSWDSEEQVWVCMRVRVDKNTPNDFNTYKKVCTTSLFSFLLSLLSYSAYVTYAIFAADF